MPRKAKDEETNETTKKKATTKKVGTTKKVAKKTTVKKDDTKKATVKSKTVAKSSVNKKSPTKKTPKTTLKTSKAKSKKAVVSTEYYDLPSFYNKTVVKILAQTPSCLFVYWEVSEKDKLKLQKQYGDNFFQNTKPFLVITNETMNYSFETEINDYANSWYIHINDSDCKYNIKLIRKQINNEFELPNSHINIISSNDIDLPNDHILFEKLGKTVFFKNVKNEVVTSKDISSISFMNNIGRIYNIYDLYKEIYKNELDGNVLRKGGKCSS